MKILRNLYVKKIRKIVDKNTYSILNDTDLIAFLLEAAPKANCTIKGYISNEIDEAVIKVYANRKDFLKLTATIVQTFDGKLERVKF